MAPEFASGERFGSFELDVHLGGGGSGSVWRARDVRTGQIVALKIIARDADRSRAEIELLAATASQQSCHIVRVFAGGIDPVPYLAMEYIDGQDYGEILAQRGPLPVDEVLALGVAIAEALTALHEVGIIHHDIKPGNLMAAADGTIKLTDFGAARIEGFATNGPPMGEPMTMAYAAPEVWDAQATHQSDLYAFGCVLYECLVGHPVFVGGIGQLYTQHRGGEPDLTTLPPNTPPALRILIQRCLAKLPSDRPRDAASCLALLRGTGDAEATVLLDALPAMGTALAAQTQVIEFNEAATTRRPAISLDAPVDIKVAAASDIEATPAASSAPLPLDVRPLETPMHRTGLMLLAGTAGIVLLGLMMWGARPLVTRSRAPLTVPTQIPVRAAVPTATRTPVASTNSTSVASAWKAVEPGALEPTYTAGLGWNPNDPVTKDARVIQALTQSTTVNQIWSPNVTLLNGEFDEANARATLVAAGYDTCPAPTRALDITLMLVDDAPSRAIADALEADWKQYLCIGVTRMFVPNLRAGANNKWQVYIYD